MKKSDIFHISTINIDCGYSLEPPRRGGSNEYPQSMFSSRNKETNVYHCKPQFYCLKVGFKGGQNYIAPILRIDVHLRIFAVLCIFFHTKHKTYDPHIIQFTGLVLAFHLVVIY